MERFDVIVIGVGGVGSAALSALARRGARVLGLDAFPPGHDRGSSHGATRIIRLAYFEEPRYVPLLRRAFAAWGELEARAGRSLYRETGLLHVGPAQGAVLGGLLASAAEHRLPLERLSPADLVRRFPGFRLTPGQEAVFEARAGYLAVEDCVRAFAAEAVAAGATLAVGERVQGFAREGDGLVVQAGAQRYAAERLVLTPGAWASQLLPDLPLAVRAVRKSLFWYPPAAPGYRVDQGAPCFLFDSGQGVFYGFPAQDELGLKVAEHSGGSAVTDPLAVDRAPWPEDQARVERFLAAHLPGVRRERRHHAVCLYELSPDEHFIVDRHPADPRVSFAVGLSGHGFKFSPVLGEVLAEMVLDGRTPDAVRFLSLDAGSRPKAVDRGA